MRDIWYELGETMRLLRRASGESLRDVESESAWGRGTLSEVENGKARPSRQLVDYYDARFAGDGVLQSLFAEAHAITPVVRPLGRELSEDWREGDAIEVVAASVPAGTAVEADSEFVVGWKLQNAGCVPWLDRRLARVGATAGTRLISGPPRVPVPDAQPGEVVEVSFVVLAPPSPGTVIAHWRMVHRNGGYCFPVSDRLAVTVVVP